MSSDNLLARRSNVTISRREILAFLGVVAGVMVVTTVPYAYGYLSSPPDRQFMGILLNVPDTAQYLSWAREFGRAVLIENKLTSEPGDPVFLNLYWLFVGRLAKALDLGLAETMQLVRPLSGIVYLGAIYWFVALVEDDIIRRLTAFLVISLGGGLGWLLVVIKQFTGELLYPLDLYVTESNTFLTVLAFPHQAMATGLLVLLLCLSALALEWRSFGLAAVAGLLGLVLGVQHGYDLLVVFGVLGAAAVALAVQTKCWLRILAICAVVGLLSAPAALYLAYITYASPIWRGVLSQYDNAGVYTPEPLHLLVLMGLPLLLVLTVRPEPAGSRLCVPRELVLGSWLVVGFLLLYVPTDFQIKMLAGWQVPVGIVATRIAFTHFAPTLRKLLAGTRWRPDIALSLALVLAVLPVNAYLLAWRFVDLSRHDYPYYLHKDELAALRWLETHSLPTDVVLSSLTLGQYIPSVSGNTAFLAHWAQTLDFFEKRRMVAQFFDGGTPGQARDEIVKRFGVRYVFHGRQERALGSYDLGDIHFTKVFSEQGTSIYRVESVSRAVEVNR
mgnify:CR=1 FL=1